MFQKSMMKWCIRINYFLIPIVFNLHLKCNLHAHKEIYRNIPQKSSKMPSLQYTKVLRMMLFNVFQKEKKKWDWLLNIMEILVSLNMAVRGASISRNLLRNFS